MFPLDRIEVGVLRLGAAGLALGSAAGAWVEYVRLRRHLARQLGPHGARPGYVPKVLLAGLIAAAVGWGAKVVLGFSGEQGVLPNFLGETSIWLDPLAAVGTALAFGVAYLGTASLLGVGMPLRKNPAQGE